MSVLMNNLVFYGSTNMPEADSATIGGAVDFSKRVMFSDVSPTGTMDYVSSSTSDTATKIELMGRDSTGAIQTETKTLNGTTVVTGSQSFERLLAGAASGASSNGPIANPGGTTAVGDIAAISHTAVVSAHTGQTGSANSTSSAPPVMKLQSGDGATVAVGQIIRTTGGTGPNQLRYIVAINPGGLGSDYVAVNRDWGTVPDNTTTYNVHEGMLFELSPNQVTAVIRPFATAAADVSGGSNRTFYEKIYAVNNNTTTALTSATILKEVDPSGSSGFQIGLGASLNDSLTATNRQTAPAGVTFTTGSAPQSQSVPGGSLTSGAAPNTAGACPVWMSLALNAGLAAGKTSFTLRQNGSTV